MEAIYLIAIKTGQLHNRNNQPARLVTNAATSKSILCGFKLNGPNFSSSFSVFIVVSFGGICFSALLPSLPPPPPHPHFYHHYIVELFASNIAKLNK